MFWFLIFSRISLAADFSFLSSQLNRVEKTQQQKIFIFYFASWCGYCEAAAPIVQKTFGKVKSCPIRFVGVAGDDDLSAVAKIKNKWKFSFQIIHDSDRKWLRYFGIRQIPRAILISEADERVVDGAGVETIQKATNKIIEWAKSEKCFHES